MMRFANLFMIVFMVTPAFALAEVELRIYAGGQSANVSDRAIRDPFPGTVQPGPLRVAPSADTSVYGGVRATRWRSGVFGLGIDLSRTKVAPSDSLRTGGAGVLELKDGLNTLTVNAYRRWNDVIGGFSPYIGGGVGVSLPHTEAVDVAGAAGGYLASGPAATWIAGASLPLSSHWSVFGEYKGTYSANTAELESGSTVETDIVTNALNVGVSFNF